VPGRQGHRKRNVGLLNPKQFYDSLQWLEHHLSNEATLRTIKHQQTTLTTNIWDVVDNVLREFDCEINHESDHARAYNRGERGQSRCKRDVVQIVPLQHILDSEKMDGTEIDADWRAYILLRRASRDLGLLLEYPQYFDTSRFIASPCTRRSRRTNSSDTYVPSFYHRPNDLVSQVFCFITSFAAAFLSLPITFATLTLTILCFYSKPRSLRIL